MNGAVGEGRREIVGQLLRTPKGRCGPVGFGHRGDFFVVGRNVERVEDARRRRGFERPSEDRLPAKRADVLAWNPFAAAAGGDNSNDHESDLITDWTSAATLPALHF